MKTTLVKIGEHISFNAGGIDYELKPGKVYNIQPDAWGDHADLIEAPDLQLPDKLFSTDADTKFVDKVLKYHESISSGTTGVLLAGLKGSGKTVMAKILAIKSKLPIISIDNTIRPNLLNDLFHNLSGHEVCVVMDEFDKFGDRYDDDYLMRMIDGIDSCGKKLFILTANNMDRVNEYMIDRCSRIRYFKEFEEMPLSLLTAIVTDKAENKEIVSSLCDFISNNFAVKSFDNISSFVEEVNINPLTTFEELFEDMNLSKK